MATNGFRIAKKPTGSALSLAAGTGAPVPDFSAAIRKEQSQVSSNIARTVTHSFSFEAITGNYIQKSIPYKNKQGKEDSFSTTTVNLTPQNLVRVARDHPNSKLYKLNAHGTGIRLALSNSSKSGDLHTTYVEGVKAFQHRKKLKTEVPIKPDPFASKPAEKAPEKPVEKALEKPAEKAPEKPIVEKDVEEFSINLLEEPLCNNPILELIDGKPLWIEFKGSFSIRPGVMVKVEGFYVDPWISDPSKKKKKDNEEEESPETEIESEWSQWEVKNPTTKKALRFTFRGAAVTELKKAQNDLPLKYRLRSLFDVDRQHWYNPADDVRKQHLRGVFALPISPDEMKPKLDGKSGSSVSSNEYIRGQKENKMSGPTDTITFYYDDTKKTQKRALLPINLKVTNWLALDKAEESYDEIEYDRKLQLHDGRNLVMKTFNVRGTLWAEDCRRSGIADLGAWVDVNLYRPVPYWAFVRFAKEIKEGTIDVEVIAAEADMQDYYLRQNGIPMTPQFVQQCFNGVTTLECPSLGSEKDNKNKEVPITNLGNTLFKNDCLVNLTEFHGDIKPYLDVKNKWEFCMLIVPTNREAAANARTSNEKMRATLLEDINKLQTAETPEDGDKKIQEWLKAKYPSIQLTDLGYLCGEFRCIIFAFKRTENRFDPALLVDRPPTVSILPVPQPDKVAGSFTPAMAPPKEDDEVQIVTKKSLEVDQQKEKLPNDPMEVDQQKEKPNTKKKAPVEEEQPKKTKRVRDEPSQDEPSSSASEVRERKPKSARTDNKKNPGRED